MKKLLVLGAFILMGSMVFAQTPSKAKEAPASVTNHMATAAPVAEAASGDVAVAKKEAKKECSDADKKQCGSKTSGKKSCCSSKAEATKEETK
jgi:hypothetical protein